jgi:hypothetical protein
MRYQAVVTSVAGQQVSTWFGRFQDAVIYSFFHRQQDTSSVIYAATQDCIVAVYVLSDGIWVEVPV